MKLDIILARINSHLERIVPEAPKTLYDPVRAALSGSGKRVRPVLTALCAGEATAEDLWLPAACAVELLHTFTLVHDDIMDNALTRRGEPTIHVAFGLNEAILSGDVIVALAMEALSKAPMAAEMLTEFSAGFKAVCEGQALDEEFEEREEVTLEEYFTMIELKTARIFELSAALGALAAGGANMEPCRQFAREIGLAFQLQDDLLDLTGDESFGKTIGGDILEGKRTILYVKAMEHYNDTAGEDRALLDRLRSRSTETADIPRARTLFEGLGILNEASRLAAEHTQLAQQHLNAIQNIEQRTDLMQYAERLLGRAV